MYISSNIVYLLTHLMSLVSFYNPEIFDLIADYNLNKTWTARVVFSETSDMKWAKDTVTSNGQLQISYLSWLKYLFKAIHSKCYIIYVTD